MICRMCGKYNEESAKYCKQCGAKLKFDEKNSGDVKNVKSRMIINKKILSIVIVGALIVGTILLNIIKKNNHSEGKSYAVQEQEIKKIDNKKEVDNGIIVSSQNSDNEKNEEKKAFDNVYLIEYLLIANYVKEGDEKLYDVFPEGIDAPIEVFSGFEVLDIDADGYDELITDSLRTNDDSARHTLSTFDANDKICSYWSDYSAAGGIDFEIIDNDKTYIKKDYNTVGVVEDSMNVWTKNGWKLENSLYMWKDWDNDEWIGENPTWEGKEIDREEWVKKRSDLKIRTIDNELQQYISIETDVDIDSITTAIYDYLKNTRKLNVFEVDNPTNSERYIIVDSYFINAWNDVKEADHNGDEMFDDSSLMDCEDIIIIRNNNNKTMISSMKLEHNLCKDLYDIKNCYYDEGIVIEDSETGYIYCYIEDSLSYVGKTKYSDNENAIMNSKWYGFMTGTDSILEYTFLKDGKVNFNEYQNNKLIESNIYFWNEVEEENGVCVLVNLGQDGFYFTYDDDKNILVEGYSACSDEEIEQKILDGIGIMIPFNGLPSYEQLSKQQEKISNEVSKKYYSGNLPYMIDFEDFVLTMYDCDTIEAKKELRKIFGYNNGKIKEDVSSDGESKFITISDFVTKPNILGNACDKITIVVPYDNDIVEEIDIDLQEDENKEVTSKEAKKAFDTFSTTFTNEYGEGIYHDNEYVWTIEEVDEWNNTRIGNIWLAWGENLWDYQGYNNCLLGIKK